MNFAVYAGEDTFVFVSDSLPPGINQMYSVSTVAVPTGGSSASSIGKQIRGRFFLSKTASLWKRTVGETVLTVGTLLARNTANKTKKDFNHSACSPFLGEGPYCAFSYMFAFENYDTDNRLKIMNDAIQGDVAKNINGIISNDKKIRKSVQFKTVVGKKADIFFLYVVTGLGLFSNILELFKEFSNGLEESLNQQACDSSSLGSLGSGVLKPEFSGKVKDRVIDYIETKIRAQKVFVSGGFSGKKPESESIKNEPAKNKSKKASKERNV